MGTSRSDTVKISRDNLQDINEVNDLTTMVVYELSQPVSHGDIQQKEVIIKRPKLKHQKKLMAFKEAEQASKMIEYTCDLAVQLIDELDLADVTTISKIILKMLGKHQEI